MALYNPPRNNTILGTYNESDFENDIQEPINGILSTINSTSSSLGISATYTGTWESVLNISSISILAESDATGTLYGQFSVDGSAISRNIQLSDGLNGQLGIHSLIPIAKYFRVKVINSTTAQTSFILQTILNINARISMPTSRMSQTLTNYSDVLNTRAVLFGVHENGVDYDTVGITAQNNIKTAIKDPLTAFGEVLTAHLTPVIQIDAVYGLIDTDVETFSASGGTASATNSLFNCLTSTTVGSYAVIRSRRLIEYRAGIGCKYRFTSMFSAGVANSIQFAGAFNVNNGLFFGYNGATFGITRRIPGKCQIVRLTITNGTNGNAVASVTLNGVLFTVNTTGVLSINQFAEQIAELGTFTGWASSVSPQSNAATITFIQNTPAVASGAYTFSSTATGAGTLATIQTGVANDDTTGFIPQSSWNLDVCDGTNSSSNPSGILLNPQKLNVYQITLAYLGAGTILFQIMDPEGHFEYVHQIEYPNANTTTNQQNPSYKVGWIAASLGSTTALSVSGGSGAGFSEGEVVSRRSPRAYLIENYNIAAANTNYIAFALRNRGEFSTIINLRQMRPILFNIGVETGSRVVAVKIYLNPTITGETIWQYTDSTRSCMEYATPANTVTQSGGSLVIAFNAGGSQTINMQELDLRIIAGDTIVFVVSSTSGANTVCDLSINWQE